MSTSSDGRSRPWPEPSGPIPISNSSTCGLTAIDWSRALPPCSPMLRRVFGDPTHSPFRSGPDRLDELLTDVVRGSSTRAPATRLLRPWHAAPRLASGRSRPPACAASRSEPISSGSSANEASWITAATGAPSTKTRLTCLPGPGVRFGHLVAEFVQPLSVHHEGDFDHRVTKRPDEGGTDRSLRTVEQFDDRLRQTRPPPVKHCHPDHQHYGDEDDHPQVGGPAKLEPNPHMQAVQRSSMPTDAQARRLRSLSHIHHHGEHHDSAHPAAPALDRITSGTNAIAYTTAMIGYDQRRGATAENRSPHAPILPDEGTRVWRPKPANKSQLDNAKLPKNHVTAVIANMSPVRDADRS